MKVRLSLIAIFTCIVSVYYYFYFKHRNAITVFLCPSNCEIGDYNGSFVKIKYVNQLLFPVVFVENENFNNSRLKSFISLFSDFRLKSDPDIGSWRMDKCVVQYNKYGLVSDIYIIGDGGYYLFEQRFGGYGSNRKIEVKDLLNLPE